MGQLFPIEIKKYDPCWPTLFTKEKQNLLRILGSDAPLRIEHIGSTAVPGLSAKPTIDMLVELPEGVDTSAIIEIMTKANYIYMKEQMRHLMFVKGYLPTGLSPESFHVHMGPKDQDWLWDRVCFRDYLREYPIEAARYEKLKKKLAAKHKHDRDAYTDSKFEYVEKITNRAKKRQE